MLSARVGQYFKWVGQSPEWVGHGLPGLGLEPPLEARLTTSKSTQQQLIFSYKILFSFSFSYANIPLHTNHH